MKQVKIISGTYGHKPKGAVSVSPISAGGIVELPDAEAMRLVGLKVAVYAEAPKPVVPVDPGADSPPSGVATPDSDQNSAGAGVNPPENETGAGGEESDETPADDDGDDEGGDGNGENDDADIPKYSTEMPLDELKDIFKDCGLAYKVGMSKVEMVAYLDEHFAADDDGEKPPALGTEEPVT